jgi:N-acyl-D-aspartate/D-glutamate deacylase
LIEEARARGVNVMAGQHPYDATNSNLSAYAVPRWAVVGGTAEMRKRFKEHATWERLMKEITEMVDIRGGAAKLVFSDENPDLNGKTLADKAREYKLSVPETVMRILSENEGVGVMNRELYDIKNAEFLAQQEWMMTCTDGGTPEFGVGIVHPRSYGAFTKKLRDYVYDRRLISLPFAIRGMTGLAASFFGVNDRGVIREGQKADIVVLDEARIRDRATYAAPHQYSEGTVHVIVNGEFAFRDGKPTGARAGRPIPRPNVPAS